MEYNYLNMILRKIINAILICYCIVDLFRTQTISIPSKIEANMKSLYSSTNTSLTNQTFTITFGITTFNSMPSFGFGINDFKMGNDMTKQNFMSSSTNLTAKTVGIYVQLDNSSIVYKFSISYIVIWEETDIFIDSRTYTSPATINSNSGPRTFNAFHYRSPINNSTAIIPFLRGFSLTAGSLVKISIIVIVFATDNYNVQISTNSDCLIKVIGYDILFYSTTTLTAQNYYFGGDTTTFSSSSLSSQYTRTLNYYQKTVFILALAGFNSMVTGPPTFSWSVINSSSNVATIQLNKVYIQSVDYSYFQIGSLSQNPTNNNNSGSSGSTGSSQGNSYIGIIAGLIVGVLLISTVVVVVAKCYMKSSVYSTPYKDDFRVLPALSF